MKAIKIASGVAVSALAAAISAQSFAAAHEGGAETSVTWSGDLRVQTVIDLENERQTHEMPGFSSANDDWYNLSASTDVVHGPFSGSIVIGLKNGEEDEADDAGNRADDGYGRVFVDNLRVDEGPISFGDIGRITDTAALYEGLTEELYFFDEDLDNETNEGTRVGVDAAFRYTLADLGVRVQAEGNSGHPFGFSAAIKQELDVATFWADTQFRQATTAQTTGNSGDTGMEDAETTFGAGLQLSPVDALTLTAVVRNASEFAGLNGEDARTTYAVKGEFAATDSISVYGMVVDNDAGNGDTDSTMFRVGGSMGIDMITLQAHYEAFTAEAAEALIHARVDYTDGAIGAFGDVKVAQEGYAGTAETGTKFEVGANYTTESGIKYESVYANAQEEWWAGVENKLTLRAQYSF